MVFIFSLPKLRQSDDLANTENTTDYSERYEEQAPLVL